MSLTELQTLIVNVIASAFLFGIFLAFLVVLFRR